MHLFLRAARIQVELINNSNLLERVEVPEYFSLEQAWVLIFSLFLFKKFS
jgi:hypothetical protein